MGRREAFRYQGLFFHARAVGPLPFRTWLQRSRKQLGNGNNGHGNNSSSSFHGLSIPDTPGTESHSKKVADVGPLDPKPRTGSLSPLCQAERV